MPEERSKRREWRVRAASVADDLRAAVAALSERRIGDADLDAAAELARSLRRHLDGPRRARWYEGEAAGPVAEERLNYLDGSPVRGRINPIAPPLVVAIAEREDGRRGVEGRARLGSAYEGPPHGVHGGWVAALFDEMLAAAQQLAESRSVTATLKIRYRDITPLDEDLRLEAWIHKNRGRILVARATCHAGDILTADAEGMFIRVDFDDIRQRMKERRARRA